jgi:hypothetical protein
MIDGCGARFGDFVCSCEAGHSGVHLGYSREEWFDGDAPDPDPRDATIARLTSENEVLRKRAERAEISGGWASDATLLAENERLRAILRDVGAMDPLVLMGGACRFCGEMAKRDREFTHDDSCVWDAARKESEGR